MSALPDPAIERVLADLKNPSPVVKKRAILEALRAKMHQTLFALKEVALQDDDVEIRYFASKALNFLRTSQPATPRPEPKAGAIATEAAGEVLRGTDTEAKIRCLQQICQARDASHLSLILEISLEESDPMVRSVLPLAIGILGNKDHADFIIQRFLKDPNARVRANAIEALERIGSPDVYPYIIGFLQDKDNRVRANAALTLNKFGKVNLIRTLDGMLRDPKVWMRDSATYALSVIKIPEAVPLLERAMVDPYEGIRIKAKRGLQGLAAKNVAGAAEVLTRYPDVKDEESLEDFLRMGELELAQAGPGPDAAAASPPAEPAAPEAVVALAAPPAEEAPPDDVPEQPAPLPPPKDTYALDTGDRDARIKEIQRAVAADDRGVAPLMVERLKAEDDHHVRATLAVAIGRLRYTEAVDALIGLMDDKDPRVRANAAEAIGLIKVERAYSSLIKHIRDPNQRVAANVLWVLHEYPHFDVYPHLEAMVAHRKEEFKRSAIWLIGQLQTYSAIKMLEKLYQDRSADIRNRAGKLLKKLRDQGVTPAKTSCLKLNLR